MRRLAPLAVLLLFSLPAMAARQVALIAEGELAPPARHGLDKLRDALRAKGFDSHRLRRAGRLRHPGRYRRIARLAGLAGSRARRPRGTHHLAGPLPEQARHRPPRSRCARTHVRRARHRRPRSPGVPPTPSSMSATPPRSPTSPNAASPCTPCSAPTSRAACTTKPTGTATSTRWPPTASTASSSSSATKTAASWRRSIPTSST